MMNFENEHFHLSMAVVTAERLNASHLDGLLKRDIPQTERKLCDVVELAEKDWKRSLPLWYFHVLVLRAEYLGYFCLLQNRHYNVKLDMKFSIHSSDEFIIEGIKCAVKCACKLFPRFAVVVIERSKSPLIPLFERCQFQLNANPGTL